MDPPSSPPTPEQVTLLLQQYSAGDRPAGEELMAVLYEELRGLARGMARHRPGATTLQPTALVHEAWLKLGQGREWEGRQHFLAVAAKAMRQILANYARDARAQKRGGGWERVTLSLAGDPTADPQQLDLVALDEALVRLAEVHPDYPRLFELIYFGGLSTAEAAELLGLSQRAVQMKWRAVRAFLTRELVGHTQDEDAP